MPKVTVTARDLQALRAVRDLLGNADVKVEKAYLKFLDKVERAQTKQPAPGANMTALAAAVSYCRKYAPMGSVGEGVYARLSKAAAAKGATPDRVELVGKWLDKQTWFRGHFTLADILQKWESWYPKAEADERGSPDITTVFARPAGFADE